VRRGTAKILLWNHRQFPISDDVGLAAVVGRAPVSPVPVRAAFLNAVPVGGRLGRIGPADIPSFGRVVGRRFHAKVGGVYSFAGARFVMLREGLAPLSKLTSRLFVGAGRVHALTAAEFAHIGMAKAAFRAELPATVPAVETSAPRALCVTYARRNGEDLVTLRAYSEQPAELGPTVGTVVRHRKNEPDVDRMVLRGGTGALLRSTTVPTTYVLTDQARRYPLANEAAVRALGYGDAHVTEVPSAIVALLPHGPTLAPDNPTW
jgi:hypothetical protein